MAPSPQNMKVLVLGASGKLGKMLRAVWAEQRSPLVDLVYCARQSPKRAGDVQWSPGDRTDHLPCVDAIVALWGAVPGSGHSLDSNSTLARSAIELASSLGATRVLHCSSAAVYHPNGAPLREEDDVEPPTDYGKSKRSMERLIEQLSQEPGAPSMVSMRIANVAGADSLFANMKPGGSLRLDRFADGQGPLRSYVAPDDLARAIVALVLAKDIAGPVNIAAPAVTAMHDLALAVGCRVAWQDAPPQAIASVSLNTSKLARILPLSDRSSDASYLVNSARRGGVWP